MALTVGILSGCSGNSATSTTAENTSAKAASDKESAASKADDKQTEAAKQKNKGSKDSDAKFTVGFDKDFPPMGFVGDSGEYKGFDLELAKEAAHKRHWEDDFPFTICQGEISSWTPNPPPKGPAIWKIG